MANDFSPACAPHLLVRPPCNLHRPAARRGFADTRRSACNKRQLKL